PVADGRAATARLAPARPRRQGPRGRGQPQRLKGALGAAFRPGTQPRQNLGRKRTSTVNTSSRPSSISEERTHLAVAGSGPKVPAGPITSPRPGPTLDSADAAPLALVRKSRPR